MEEFHCRKISLHRAGLFVRHGEGRVNQCQLIPTPVGTLAWARLSLGLVSLLEGHRKRDHIMLCPPVASEDSEDDHVKFLCTLLNVY